MAVIAVFNQKGGVGKTPPCLNVTAALEIAQHFPVALDLDPQGHLTLSSGVAKTMPDAGMAAFFKHKTPVASLLQATPRGWQIIPASLELAKIDALFASGPKAARPWQLGKVASIALSGGPVLIDCCP